MEQATTELPRWMLALDEEDVQFLKRFLLSSGSLKAVAEEYGVSYPTVRARLDRLIEKVRVADDPRIRDPFERRVRMLVADGELAAAHAKELLEIHRSTSHRRNGP